MSPVPRGGGVVAAVLALALVLGCGPAAGSIGGPHLTVFAAASMRDALGDAAAAYEEAADVELTLTFDSSAALAAQIRQGAPADVLAAADLDTPRRLIEADDAFGPVAPFATNRIVLVVPTDNPAEIRTPVDLAGEGLRIVAAGEQVPITRYADQVVARLGRLPGYPAGFADAVAANVVSREDNVRAVLAKVALGEADAGFVYATDAGAADGVLSIEIPEAARVVATYGAVVVAGTSHRDAAGAFVEWLAGPDGGDVLAAHGFGPPSAG